VFREHLVVRRKVGLRLPGLPVCLSPIPADRLLQLFGEHLVVLPDRRDVVEASRVSEPKNNCTDRGPPDRLLLLASDVDGPGDGIDWIAVASDTPWPPRGASPRFRTGNPATGLVRMAAQTGSCAERHGIRKTVRRAGADRTALHVRVPAVSARLRDLRAAGCAADLHAGSRAATA